MSWDGMGLGKGLGGQNPGLGIVLLADGSLTFLACVSCACLTEVFWGWGQDLTERGGIACWNSMSLGKGPRGQSPGRGSVVLAGESLTRFGWCGLADAII